MAVESRISGKPKKPGDKHTMQTDSVKMNRFENDEIYANRCQC